jgi:hypothetical protein
MVTLLLIIGALVIDFLIVAFCFWLVTLLLPFLGITIAFSWGKAIVIWVICKVIKLLF